MPSHDYQKSGLKIILEDSFKLKNGQVVEIEYFEFIRTNYTTFIHRSHTHPLEVIIMLKKTDIRTNNQTYSKVLTRTVMNNTQPNLIRCIKIGPYNLSKNTDFLVFVLRVNAVDDVFCKGCGGIVCITAVALVGSKRTKRGVGGKFAMLMSLGVGPWLELENHVFLMSLEGI